MKGLGKKLMACCLPTAPGSTDDVLLTCFAVCGEGYWPARALTLVSGLAAACFKKVALRKTFQE
jgi:hypothetical protein